MVNKSTIDAPVKGPTNVLFGNVPSKGSFKTLSFEQLLEFYVELKKDGVTKHQSNDGSVEYKKAVIQAAAVRGFGKTRLKKDLNELFERAISANPVMEHSHTNWRLIKTPDRFDDDQFGSMVMPIYDNPEDIKRVLYQANSERGPWHASLWKDDLAKIVVTKQGIDDLPEKKLYQQIVKYNPDLRVSRAIEFHQDTMENPDEFAIKYGCDINGKVIVPKLLTKLQFMGDEVDTPVLLPDELEDKIERNLQVIKEWNANWEEYRESGVSPLSNMLLFGPPDTGKTTITRYFVNKVREANPDALVLDVGRLREVYQDGLTPNALAELFHHVRMYSLSSGNPCILIWDEVTELLKKNHQNDVERDKLKTAIKNIVGGTYKIPGSVIVGTGNGNIAGIEDAFYTEKRFGPPIMVTHTEETRFKLIHEYIIHYGIKHDENKLESDLAILPSYLEVGTLISIMEKLYVDNPEKNLIAEDYFVAISDHMLKEEGSIKIRKSEDISNRANYVAGIITTSLALGVHPFSATINDTAKTGGPTVYFPPKKDNLESEILVFLTYVGGFEALSSFEETTLAENDMFFYARKFMNSALVNTISKGITAYGLDSIADIREEIEGGNLPPAIYDLTLDEATKYVNEILQQNQEVFSKIVGYLEQNLTINFQQLQNLKFSVRIENPSKVFTYNSSSTGIYNSIMMPSKETMGFVGMANK
jgi:SpoVK/Ycf46/Vps4 family AAA+-type ATPase